MNCEKKKKKAKEFFEKKNEKIREKKKLKEGNEKSNFQNLEGSVLRRGQLFHDAEVTLDDSEKN